MCQHNKKLGKGSTEQYHLKVMNYNLVPSVTQAFQNERDKIPKLHGFKISDEKCLHNDKKEILSYESITKSMKKAMYNILSAIPFQPQTPFENLVLLLHRYGHVSHSQQM